MGNMATHRIYLPPSNQVYNFYTFQSMEKGFSSSYPSAKLSLTSVNFLSGNGMDWNSWIRDGIPFMDEEGIKMERQRLDREVRGRGRGWGRGGGGGL